MPHQKVVVESKIQSMKKWLIMLLLVSGLSCQAGTVSYTNSIASTLTDWTNSLPLAQFDPALGNLVSIQVSVTSDLATSLNVQNNSVSPSSGTAITQLKQYLSTGTYALFGGSPVLDYASPDFNYDIGGNDFIISGLLTSSASAAGNLVTDSATLADFTGTGYMNFTAYTFTRTFLSNLGGNTGASQTTTSDFTAVITYDFSAAPVPEPSILAFGGMGIAGLVMHRRFRKQAGFPANLLKRQVHLN